MKGHGNFTENRDVVQGFPSRSTRGTDPDTEDYGYGVHTGTPDSSSAHDRAVDPGGW
jgi:hypothetical protein